MDDHGLEAQRELVQALSRPGVLSAAPSRPTLIETHISFVLLTGRFAYKIKKAVDLGFVDYTTLARRRYFCDEELRLNRRLAPELYLDVVAIGGTPSVPRLGAAADDDDAIEHAVRMIEFPQDNLLDRVLARGDLSSAYFDRLAGTVADFHGRIDRARPGEGRGDAAAVCAPVLQNFDQVRPLLDEQADRAELGAVEDWSRRACQRLAGAFAARLEQGFVRECHGDLHLGNMVLRDDRLEVFDCIEFNPNLRWIDVASEVAFLVMDLSERGRPDYANRFLNDYLELTGDYAGLGVLRFYLVYRAMVRAKVARIRAAQAAISAAERTAALSAYGAYLRYARRIIDAAPRALVITHGLSGSGKTICAGEAVERLGAVRVRSDVERKRLQGLGPLARSDSAIGGGLYGEASTAATYDRLAEIARVILAAGFPAVVDATFLKRGQRSRFRALAAALGVPFVILDCQAEDVLLRQRVAARQAAAGDASEATLAVLEHQMRSRDPLDGDEAATALTVDPAHWDAARLAEDLRRRMA